MMLFFVPFDIDLDTLQLLDCLANRDHISIFSKFFKNILHIHSLHNILYILNMHVVEHDKGSI
jgi:hypothetical protein